MFFAKIFNKGLVKIFISFTELISLLNETYMHFNKIHQNLAVSEGLLSLTL